MSHPRAIYLRVDQVRRLDHWCATLRNSFGADVYLVGSVLDGPGARDVDVRIVIDDDDFENIPLTVLDLNMILSQWGYAQTGLPIDCQVQLQSECDQHRKAGNVANPRGFLLRDPKKFTAGDDPA